MTADTPTVKLAELATRSGKAWIPYEVKRSPRAKYIRLTVTAHGTALLTLPGRATVEEGLYFLKSKGDWLTTRIEARRSRPSLRQFLAQQAFLSAEGKRLALTLSIAKAKDEITWNLDREECHVAVTTTDHDEVVFADLIHKFAKVVAKNRAYQLANQIGQAVNRVTVRNQSTVWGSCSDSRNISLNWRIVLLPPELQDYIIYHELAHLTHMNHSRAFWKLVEKYDPCGMRHDGQITGLSQEIIPLGR